MDKQRQDDQLESTYNSSVPIQDVALKTYQEQWTIEKGGGRGSGKSVLIAQQDDDDDDLYTGCSSNTGHILKCHLCDVQVNLGKGQW